MEIRTGHLFDLGPDGLGFIADSADKRIWAFRYPNCGLTLAPNLKAFLKLEGLSVQFAVEQGQVESIRVARKAAAAHP